MRTFIIGGTMAYILPLSKHLTGDIPLTGGILITTIIFSIVLGIGMFLAFVQDIKEIKK